MAMPFSLSLFAICLLSIRYAAIAISPADATPALIIHTPFSPDAAIDIFATPYAYTLRHYVTYCIDADDFRCYAAIFDAFMLLMLI